MDSWTPTGHSPNHTKNMTATENAASALLAPSQPDLAERRIFAYTNTCYRADNLSSFYGRVTRFAERARHATDLYRSHRRRTDAMEANLDPLTDALDPTDHHRAMADAMADLRATAHEANLYISHR